MKRLLMTLVLMGILMTTFTNYANTTAEAVNTVAAVQDETEEQASEEAAAEDSGEEMAMEEPATEEMAMEEPAEEVAAEPHGG